MPHPLRRRVAHLAAGATVAAAAAVGALTPGAAAAAAGAGDAPGYVTVTADGSVTGFGAAQGQAPPAHLARPVVGAAATPDGAGEWLVAGDGGVLTEGDARFFGSTGGISLNRPVVGMAATPDGGGYWLVASDGGVFAFGDAPYLGSGADDPTSPVVALARTQQRGPATAPGSPSPTSPAPGGSPGGSPTGSPTPALPEGAPWAMLAVAGAAVGTVAARRSRGRRRPT
ncbi:MAG TPA: hypothetical protein VFP61_14680 [Acidimicrobiales bacterium]|nr:hypothetical protein [Acidimicrobiales bacterium]